MVATEDKQGANGNPVWKWKTLLEFAAKLSWLV